MTEPSDYAETSVAGQEAGPEFPDFAPAGNQGADPDTYEIENRALDPEERVLDAMRDLAPWRGCTTRSRLR